PAARPLPPGPAAYGPPYPVGRRSSRHAALGSALQSGLPARNLDRPRPWPRRLRRGPRPPTPAGRAPRTAPAGARPASDSSHAHAGNRTAWRPGRPGDGGAIVVIHLGRRRPPPP